MTLQLFNTLGRSLQKFSPIRDGEVSFYTCGPTVYNHAHIGNMRAYLAADTLRRWLTHGHQYNVKWVMNITDIEDKIIRDSKIAYPDAEPMQALKQFTQKYEDLFYADLEQLNIPKSAFFANPKATEFIVGMQELIRNIAKRGYAYEVDGSIFFDVKKWAADDTYGKLLHLDLDNLKTGTRSMADEVEKHDLSDFVLWKAEKPGEPSWNFDFEGTDFPGRPGWHLECSVMENEYFDLPFDIHSGGVDLIFPHHEDEIAQSACGYECEPTRFWLHNEHLMVDGKKMSKSLGNFYTLADLIEKGNSTEAVRFFLVSNHYRSKVNLTDESITAAANGLEKIRNFLHLATSGDNGETRPQNRVASLAQQAEQDFRAAMDDDLNTSVAIAAVHGLVSDVMPLLPLSADELESMQGFFTLAQNTFGVPLFPKGTKAPAEVIALAEQRLVARQEKDWPESDRLRDAIAELGFTIRDTSDGYDLLPVS